MFGYRKDGTKLNKVDPILRFTSYIMPYRYDAQVSMPQDIRCEKIDKFIEQQRALGKEYSYMHIVIAGLVRMYAVRPKLRRFIMSGRVYSREEISIAFAVKKSLTDSGEETTIKLNFTGKETLDEIREMIDKEVAFNKNLAQENSVDKLAKKLLSLPHFILNPSVKFLKWLDKIGLLPSFFTDMLPFHVCGFLTNMKSLGTNHVYHHIYDFGTCSQFISMGKEKLEPVVNLDKEIEIAKIMKLGMTVDERICDGVYNTKAIKVAKRHMENPELLMNSLEEIDFDPDLTEKQLIKVKKKLKKIREKK